MDTAANSWTYVGGSKGECADISCTAQHRSDVLVQVTRQVSLLGEPGRKLVNFSIEYDIFVLEFEYMPTMYKLSMPGYNYHIHVCQETILNQLLAFSWSI